MSSSSDGQVRFVGMLAGTGSGLTKVAVGQGSVVVLCDNLNSCSPPGSYISTLDCFYKTVRLEGFRALYKGATPPAVGWSAIDSVLLGSLHNYRLFLMRQHIPGLVEYKTGTEIKRLTVFGHGIAGFFAGLTSAFVATPVELIKVKLQLQRGVLASQREYTGPIHCLRRVIQTDGLSGLWTGLQGSLLFRSNFLWMFSGYEILMRGFNRLHDTGFETNDGVATFISGGLASFAFWFMAIPADNIKNRMMASPIGGVKLSAYQVARRVYVEDGLRGFTKGLIPVLLRAFPVNASALFVYEGLMKLLGAEKV